MLSEIIDNLEIILNGSFPSAWVPSFVPCQDRLEGAIEVFIPFCEQHGVLKKIADDIETLPVTGVLRLSSQYNEEGNETFSSGRCADMDEMFKSLEEHLLQFVP